MNRDRVVVHQALLRSTPPNGRAFSGEPSERSERPERMRGQRVRCNAMLGGTALTAGPIFRTSKLSAAGTEVWPRCPSRQLLTCRAASLRKCQGGLRCSEGLGGTAHAPLQTTLGHGR